MKLNKIIVKITPDDLMDYSFQVTTSIYTKQQNTKQYRTEMYLAECMIVKDMLDRSNSYVNDIITFKYRYGTLYPYGIVSGIMEGNFDGYMIEITYKSNDVAAIKSMDATEANIRKLFLTTEPEGLKSLYRKLSLVYHPDKTGGEDKYMKLLNELKVVYKL